jgi:uncharacterized membrane protein
VSAAAGRTRRLRAAWIGLPPLAALVVLARRLPPDGRDHAPLAQFFGRFHPSVVHFPIALLLLAALVEVAGATRRWRPVRDAAGPVLALATVAAFAAAALGWLLAWSGSYRGAQVTDHMWCGVWLCAACLACLVLRRRGTGGPGAVYALALAATVALTAVTGHLGGRLTYGDNYLTAYLPARPRAWLGLPPVRPPATPAAGSVPAAAGTPFYAAAIAPILGAHCTVCHDANKQKGKLRLDTYEWVMSGGEDGPVVRPGDLAHSELYRRITLPVDDDDFMPSDGKPPLKAADVMLIAHWITTGAAAMRPDRYVPVVAAPAAAPAAAPDYRPLLEKARQLSESLGVDLLPRSQVPTDGLILRATSAPGRCGDAALAALAPIADLVVEAALARTPVTDACLGTLAGFRNLQVLDLSHTAITSANLGALAPLRRLTSLNLTDTALDAGGLAKLRAMPGLRHIYYYQTRAFPADGVRAGKAAGAPAGRARAALRRIVANGRAWVRVHAAEVLIAYGEGDAMRALFGREAPAAAASPYRIGTWRILAAAARTPAERAGWVARIEAEAIDPTPDPGDPSRRLRALESLGKLRVRVDGPVREATRVFAAAAAPVDAALPLWVLSLAGDSGAPGRLAGLLSAPDPVARQRAAYALRWLGSTDPVVLGKLRRAADSEPAGTAAWPFLASAALLLDPGAPGAPAWRSGLETLPPVSTPDAKFEAAQALMPFRNAEDLRRMAALLDDPDDAVRVNAAWTILYAGAHELPGK